MIICICYDLNEEKIKNLISSNKITTVKDLHKLKVCDECKKCCCDIKKIIQEITNNYEI